MAKKRKYYYYEENRYLFPDFELKNKKVKLIYNIWGVITVLGGVFAILPFIWMIITSLLPQRAIFLPVNEVLKSIDFNFKNYSKVWEIIPFYKYIINSLIVSISVVIGQILISSMAAYSLSKLNPPFGKIILLLFLSTIMVPFETIAIPLYLFMREFSLFNLYKTNLLNTYWALILPATVNAFNIFIFKSFFDKLPDDFIEAARIDGYSETSIFFKIILPISKPIIVVLSILSFVSIWNSFFWPLIVVNDPSIYTLMLGVYKIIEEGYSWNIVMSGVAISMMPTFILFVLFQRQIVRGVIFTTLQE